MKAWRVHENGEPRAAMRLDEVPDPQPGPGELLLKVRAANVNFPDALLCRGHYQVRPPLPFTPGVEFCGEVVALGEGVTGPAAGDRVISPAALPGGAFAELAVVPAAGVLPAPPRWTTPRPPPSTSATRPAGSGCTGGRGSARARPCSCTPRRAVSAAPPSSSARRRAPR